MTEPSSSPWRHLQGFRADLLWFPDPQKPQLSHLQDGLLVTGQGADGIVRIVAIGPYKDI